MRTRSCPNAALFCAFALFYGDLASASAQVAVRSPSLETPLSNLIVAVTDAVDAPATPSPSPKVNENGMAETERVMVTGSNIPTAAEVGPNPVQIIDRDTIEKSGERSSEELIRNLPITNALGVSASSNAGGFTAGAAGVALRGFDASETLVLIDGRRVAPFPLGSDGVLPFVDLSSIPRAAIQSIEILKDGASSIYGADAVAGVVNIKLRHDYTGAESTVEYGNTLDKDSSEFAASLLFGVGDSKAQTNITGLVDYYHRNSIYDRDRGFSNVTRPFLSANSSPFNLELSRAAVVAAGGAPDPALGDTFIGRAPFFNHGTAPASTYAYTGGYSSFFNINKYTTALPDSQRYGGFVNADHKIFGDQLVVYADFFYQNVQTDYERAPPNTGDFNTPGFTTIAIPPHAPGAVLGGPTYAETGVTPGAFNPSNPFQQIISGSSRARLVDFGDRFENDEADAFFTTAGIRGDKLFNGTWGYDLGFRYGEDKNTSTGTYVSSARFNRLLNAADPIFDPASPQFIGTTVPYNPFGDYRRPIASNKALVPFATIHPISTELATLLTIDLNIYTTDLFPLPAGSVGLAFGGQFRREHLEQNADKFHLVGDVTGENIFDGTTGDRDADALYAEASIPIFGSAFNAPGFHALDIVVSARYEEFRTTGDNVLVPSVGVRWQPFDDSLTFRATLSEGFHEPSLIELFGSPGEEFLTIFDPVKKVNVPETRCVILSNPTLQPEDSRSFTGGFVYTPKFIPGLTAIVDLYDIETQGRVDSAPDFNAVALRVSQGKGLPGEQAFRDANGNLVSLQAMNEFGGPQKSRGADFTLSYQIPTRFGTFTSTTQATFLDSFQYADNPFVPEIELRSSAVPGLQSFDGFLKWKGVSRFNWDWQHLNIGITANYRDGFREIARSGSEHWVQQTWFFDLHASYGFSSVARIEPNPVPGYSKNPGAKNGVPSTTGETVPSRRFGWRELLDGSSVAIGCTDVFGQDPPRSLVNYPRALYDPTGRFVYFSVTKKFW